MKERSSDKMNQNLDQTSHVRGHKKSPLWAKGTFFDGPRVFVITEFDCTSYFFWISSCSDCRRAQKKQTTYCTSESENRIVLNLFELQSTIQKMNLNA